MFFFFKQKTAYEMRISDWSSDVCSSDLTIADAGFLGGTGQVHGGDIAFDFDDVHGADVIGVDTEKFAGFRIDVGLALAEDAVRRHVFFEAAAAVRSEERRVGKECVRTVNTGLSPEH